ncbi:MAG TPA: hypothetical protein VFY11_14800 [Nocardioidaceae bacterium]|nr:hypothetical protein [Nocardioidaceae bacterium]
MSDVIERTAKMFAVNTAGHQLTILHDDGLYRHVRFGRPDTGLYRYELVTWPGHLAVGGDIDSYTFARVDDMFTFFRGQRINPSYWAEKVQDGRERTREYSESMFKVRVMDELKHMPVPNLTDELREARAELLERMADGDAHHPEGARELLNDAERAGLFSDTWEWSLQDWDYHFVYCLHAIVATIKAYDAAKVVAQ